MTTLQQIREKVYEATGVPESSIVYGRPVMLHDVLRAIYAKEPKYKTFLTLECDGQFIEHNDRGHYARATWNLSLPLDEQSPETIDFLAKILL